jgi:hypothetical protein
MPAWSDSVVPTSLEIGNPTMEMVEVVSMLMEVLFLAHRGK